MMNIAKGSFSLGKSIARVGHLIIIAAILVAALPAASAQAVSAHPGLAAVRASVPAAAQAGNLSPTQSMAGGSDSSHACLLTPQGGVLCWGANWSGQLGDGTNTDSPLPVAVNGLYSDVMGVSIGGFRTCALTTHGKVFCWGNYADGTNASSTPVEVSGLGGQVIQIAVGESHACALTSSGSVLCWGFNTEGELGDGTYTDSWTPVTAISSGAIQIASSVYTSCAVMSGGAVKCWGDDFYGMLGDGRSGNGINSNIPVNVLLQGGSPLTGVTQISIGLVMSCALANGNVLCWGRNRYGQLGIGTTDMSTHPYAGYVLTAQAGPALSGVDQLAVGQDHVCVHLSSGDIQCWGHNNFGQIGNGDTTFTDASVSTLPVDVLNSAGSAPLSGVSQLSAGSYSTCVFTSWEDDQPFWCWGINTYGQLGIGSTSTGSALPVPVSDISSFIPVVKDMQIVAGGEHTCSLSAGGGVKCWGSNAYGQLGDGTTSDSPNPLDVAGLNRGVKSLALGQDHTCALLDGGQLKCWGRNNHGQLGNSTTKDGLLPAGVAITGAYVVQVAAGDNHTCALTDAGSVLCWGANDSGQLGDGTTLDKPTPVTAIPSGASGIALGGATSCAVMTAGGVKCWGLGDVGQLGDGNSGSGYHQTNPTDVLTAAANPLAGASQIAVGTNFACALKDKNVYCWGGNLLGQMGNGAASTKQVFAGQVLTAAGGEALQGVTQIAAGGLHACAHLYTDRLKCWGDNSDGQLGSGITDPYSAVPLPVLDPSQTTQALHRTKGVTQNVPYLEGAAQVSADGIHTCAFFGWEGYNPYACWGGNNHGQLGDGTNDKSPSPAKIQDLLSFSPPPVKKIVAGTHFSCALTPAGGVKCWGDNSSGQLGDGTNVASPSPVQVSGLQSGVLSLDAGYGHVCALTTAGGIKCWGLNDSGQLGDGTKVNRNQPVDVNGLTNGVLAVVTGKMHSCALTSAGGVKCWGNNDGGQLGDGTQVSKSTPVDVTGLASGVISLTSGDLHNCVLTSAGGVKCWGYNMYGVIGNGTHANAYVPVTDVIGLSSGVVSLSAGWNHTCVLTSAGGVKCWGDNSGGQLGNGSNIQPDKPDDVIGLSTGVVDIAASSGDTCAVTTVGGVKCWGTNESGQLGNGTDAGSDSPVNVSGLASGVTSITTGLEFACVIVSGSIPMLCWGENSYGQFGNGTTTSSWTPVDSKWLTADGLVEDQKTTVILIHPDTAVVVPSQHLFTLHIIVHVTIVPSPPPPCTNCVPLSNLPVIDVDDDKPPLTTGYMAYLMQNYGSHLQASSANRKKSGQKSATGAIDESKLNLYHYVNGTWVPMLPCTGCSLDTTKHVLIANLDGTGLYEIMENTTKLNFDIFLPLLLR